MRKNLKLFKKIMVKISELTYIGGFFSSNIDIKEYSPEEIAYNLTLLVDDGYVDAKSSTHASSSYNEYLIFGLTNKGEDYLKSLEVGKVEAVKKFVIDNIIVVSLNAFIAALIAILLKLFWK